jgi:hypothetical protein
MTRRPCAAIAKIDALQDAALEETIICRFRFLLERHALALRIFDAVRTLLA